MPFDIQPDVLPQGPYDNSSTQDAVDLAHSQANQMRLAAQQQALQIQNDQQQKLSSQLQDQQNVSKMAGEAPKWAQNPAYEGKSWAQVVHENPEVPAHFGFDVYGNAASAAPEIWNNAQEDQTGAPLAQYAPPTTQNGQVDEKQFSATHGGLTSTQFQDIIDKTARDELPPPTMRGGLPPAVRAQLMGALAEQHPEYTAQDYPTRLKAREDFVGSGKAGQNITSINTVIGHLGELSDAVDGLNNSNTLPGPVNATKNFLGNDLGLSSDRQAKVARFTNAANAVANEMGRVFTGNAPTLQSIKEWRAGLNPNLSDEALKQSIQSQLTLLASRATALQDQWENSVKQPRSIPFLQGNSPEILQKLGANPDDFEPGYTPPTPQQAARQRIAARQTGQNTQQATQADQDAQAWATQHPDDPRAAQILAALRSKGITQ